MTSAASSGAVVEPGVYRHYKGGLYRVLFRAPFWGHRAVIAPDRLLSVCVSMDIVGVRLSSGTEFMTAKWSGNDGDGAVAMDELLVVYVSLAEHGRVSVRTAKQFVEQVGCSMREAAPGFTTVVRFERIGP